MHHNNGFITQSMGFPVYIQFLFSSVVPPKTIDEYRRDRDLSLKSLLVVCASMCDVAVLRLHIFTGTINKTISGAQ